MAGLLSGRRAPFQKTLCTPHSPMSQGVRVRVARFLKDQLFYLAIAVVIYGIFWAIRPEATNLFITVVYTLSLCNLITFALERLSFLYFERRPLHYWLIYLALLLALTPLMVTVTTGIVFWLVDRPGGESGITF